MSKEPPIDRSEDSFEALLRESARITADYDADEQDLETSSQSEISDRAALRRVKGFSTQLQDISDAEYRELQLERVILIGVWTEGTAEMAENSLDELKALAQTAGSEVLDGFIQRRDKPDPATYIGSGKVEELRNVVASSGADTVICDGELSPSQLQQLEAKLKVKVVDRTALILDIFAQHAKSKEGKAHTKRQERRRNNIASVAIAGYTNAGKSSLLNKLTGAGVLVQNALFATLDPTVRKTNTADGRIYTLTDTVGFVRHLPHQLVDAFKSTLEEVSDADVIVHVVDGSHTDPFEQIRAVRTVFNEIGAQEVPEIIAINKADVADQEVLMEILRKEPNSYAISVKTGFGIDALIHAIEKTLPRPKIEIDVVIPYNRGDLISSIHESGEILSEEYVAEGTAIHARVDGGLARQIQRLQE